MNVPKFALVAMEMARETIELETKIRMYDFDLLASVKPVLMFLSKRNKKSYSDYLEEVVSDLKIGMDSDDIVCKYSRQLLQNY